MSAPVPASPQILRFAQGVFQVARLQKAHDPRVLAPLLSVSLHDPEKWSGQPDGTHREARWRNPASRLGVRLVWMTDVPVCDGRDVCSSTDVALAGRPCIPVRTIEQAAGKRATYGGTALPVMVLDAPEATPPPYQLGNEYSSLVIAGRHGETLIEMHARSPGPQGYLDRISLHSTSLAPGPPAQSQ